MKLKPTRIEIIFVLLVLIWLVALVVVPPYVSEPHHR